MKDFLFLTDLLSLLQHDSHYSDFKNLAKALAKLDIPCDKASDNVEQMHSALATYIMDQAGESEPFLAEIFVEPDAVAALLKKHGLKAPAALQAADTAENDVHDLANPADFDKFFDNVCRNCGTVTDPLASAYRTPIGHLIFKTYLTTRTELGVRATGRYVLEHLEQFDDDKIIANVDEKGVTWKDEESQTQQTTLENIKDYVFNFDREIEEILRD